jgi:hypothetical protein
VASGSACSGCCSALVGVGLLLSGLGLILVTNRALHYLP